MIKLKNLRSRESENANFDRINLKSMVVLSHNTSDKSWEAKIVRRL